jgi:hypothetical protein
MGKYVTTTSISIIFPLFLIGNTTTADTAGTAIFANEIDNAEALVDAAVAEFDRCFSKLPPGRYAEGELERLCPYRQVTRDQQKQTCLVTTRGTIGKPLADGSGYEVEVNETTNCDFVGYGRSGDTSTSFTPCFNNYYKGVATLSSQETPATEQQKFLRSLKNRMTKMCSKIKAGRKMSNTKMQQCVVRQMAKVMAAKRS